MLRDEEKQWELQVDHSLFAIEKLDITVSLWVGEVHVYRISSTAMQLKSLICLYVYMSRTSILLFIYSAFSFIHVHVCTHLFPRAVDQMRLSCVPGTG